MNSRPGVTFEVINNVAVLYFLFNM